MCEQMLKYVPQLIVDNVLCYHQPMLYEYFIVQPHYDGHDNVEFH